MKIHDAFFSLVLLGAPCFATTVYIHYTEYLSNGQIEWVSSTFDLTTHPTNTLVWSYVISSGADINGDLVSSVIGTPGLVWLGDSIQNIDLSPLTIVASISNYYVPINDAFPTGPGTEQPSVQTATSVRYYGNLTGPPAFYAASKENILDGEVPEPAPTLLIITGLVAAAVFRGRRAQRNRRPQR